MSKGRQASVLLKRMGLALAALLLAPSLALAATDVVTSTADSGPGSLRNTISAASSGDTITFSLSTPTAITLSSGPLLIAKSLTFSGPGYSNLTISGGTTVQIMQVNATGVSIAGLSLANGLANGTQTQGAAIYIDAGSVSLTQCWLADNAMDGGGGLGGAVYVGEDASLTVEDSTFVDNTVTASGAGSAEGGAIYGDTGSVITINRSNLSNNSVYCPGCGAGPDNPLDVDGGALYISDGSLTMNGCLVSGNHADDHDGALAWYGTSSNAVDLTNCTFSGNTGIEEGAVAALAAGHMTLLNCTITDNTSQYYEAGLSGYDGEGTGGGVTAQNCVIAGNIAENTEGDDPNDVDIFVDIDGDYGSAETLTSDGWNLVGKSGSQTYPTLETGDGENDTVGSDTSPANPNLASLAANGGYAETVGFTTGTGVPASPGSSNGAPFVDGRGYLRPGSDSTSSDGAYQENGTLPVATAMSGIGDTGFTANWTAVSGASGYYLDVATDAAFANLVSGYDSLAVTGATSKSVTGLSFSTTYYYRVRAYVGSYISWYSNTISGSTVAASPTDTPTDSPTRTSTKTATPSATLSDTLTATHSPTWTISPSSTKTYTDSPTETSTGTITDSPTVTPTFTPSDSPTDTPSFTASDSPTSTFTQTDSPSVTASFTATPSFSATDSPTSTSTGTDSPSVTASFTATPSFSATDSRTSTSTRTDSPTVTESFTATPSFTATDSRTSTSTRTDSPTVTASFTATPSFSATDSPTSTSTRTDSPTVTESFTATPSFTATDSRTATSTRTDSPTVTESFTATPSFTASPTFSVSPTISYTFTPAPTQPYLSSGLGTSQLGPVPAHRGEPICLYFKAAPSSSQWIVYSMDQSVVARLNFGGEAEQCWTQTNNVAPGVYWVQVQMTYAAGGSETKIFKIMVVN